MFKIGDRVRLNTDKGPAKAGSTGYVTSTVQQWVVVKVTADPNGAPFSFELPPSNATDFTRLE